MSSSQVTIDYWSAYLWKSPGCSRYMNEWVDLLNQYTARVTLNPPVHAVYHSWNFRAYNRETFRGTVFTITHIESLFLVSFIEESLVINTIPKPSFYVTRFSRYGQFCRCKQSEKYWDVCITHSRYKRLWQKRICIHHQEQTILVLFVVEKPQHQFTNLRRSFFS